MSFILTTLRRKRDRLAATNAPVLQAVGDIEQGAIMSRSASPAGQTSKTHVSSDIARTENQATAEEVLGITSSPIRSVAASQTFGNQTIAAGSAQPSQETPTAFPDADHPATLAMPSEECEAPESEASDDEEDDTEPQERNFVRDIPPEVDRSENAKIWETYVTEAEKFDKGMIDGWNETIDVFLIFTALFSAILTAFVIVSYPMLQQDNTQATVDGLVVISMQLAAGFGQNPSMPPVYQPQSFSVPTSALWINGLWFTSLAISLITAVLAMLLKQWIRMYTEKILSTPIHRTRQRQFRYDGLLSWRVPGMVNSLPIFIHVTVFLFLAGQVVFLSAVSTDLAKVIGGILGVAVVAYLSTAFLPLVVPSCPYKSQLTAFFKQLLNIPITSAVRGVMLKLQSRHAFLFWISLPITLPLVMILNLSRNITWIIPSEDSVIAGDPQTIEMSALGWLVNTTANKEVREAALLAAVEWTPLISSPAKAWLNVTKDIANAASAVVRDMLQGGGLRDEQMAHLASHASLVERALSYRQWAPPSEVLEPLSSPLRLAVRLYKFWSPEAWADVNTELSLRSYMMWWGRSSTQTMNNLLLSVSRLLSSSANIPKELLSSGLALLCSIVLTVPSPRTWSNYVEGATFPGPQTTSSVLVAQLRILLTLDVNPSVQPHISEDVARRMVDNTVRYVANNVSLFDSREDAVKLIDLLCQNLPTAEVRQRGSTVISRRRNRFSPSAKVIMKAVSALLESCTSVADYWDLSDNIALYLLHTTTYRPAIAIALQHMDRFSLPRSSKKSAASHLMLNGTFKSIVGQIQESEDFHFEAALRVLDILFGIPYSYVESYDSARSHLDPQVYLDLVAKVIESGLLDIIEKIVMSQINLISTAHSAHTSATLLLVLTIIKWLTKHAEGDVKASGVVKKILNLLDRPVPPYFDDKDFYRNHFRGLLEKWRIQDAHNKPAEREESEAGTSGSHAAADRGIQESSR